ncbi:MAG: anaerobic ribonucleoside-triphosphate reductase activating protein [Peptostreptococcaceae bacterium]
MKYLKIEECDTKNGEGCRVTVWFSGCNMIPKCKGCFNPSTWDCNSGIEFTEDTKQYLLGLLSNEYISGLTITGGNPTDYLSDGVIIDLAKEVKEAYPNKTIWLWSGSVYEDLIKRFDSRELLEYVDVLVDGRFTEELKDKSLAWRGSKNQRCLDVHKTLNNGRMIIWGEK